MTATELDAMGELVRPNTQMFPPVTKKYPKPTIPPASKDDHFKPILDEIAKANSSIDGN